MCFQIFAHRRPYTKLLHPHQIHRASSPMSGPHRTLYWLCIPRVSALPGETPPNLTAFEGLAKSILACSGPGPPTCLARGPIQRCDYFKRNCLKLLNLFTKDHITHAFVGPLALIAGYARIIVTKNRCIIHPLRYSTRIALPNELPFLTWIRFLPDLQNTCAMDVVPHHPPQSNGLGRLVCPPPPMKSNALPSKIRSRKMACCNCTYSPLVFGNLWPT